ncbi:MAG: pyridoxal phosphate-dependent aminotransferase [Anaerolineales bacterium]
MTYRLAEKVTTLELSATDEVDNIVKRMKQDGVSDIISFGGGEPCFDTPENIKRAANQALLDGKTKYEPTTGDVELREQISLKFKRDNGMKVDPEDIIVTPGAKFAVYLAFQALLEPGDQVMVLDPAWVSYQSMAHVAGAGTVHIPSYAKGGFQPDLDRIKQSLNRNVRVIVVNSPCNPTGAVYDRATLKAIAELAARNGTLLLCDEIYEYLIYEGSHYSPASEYENIITVNGFSKSHAMTGWRLGYVTGPKEVLEGMVKIYQHSATCVTAFAQAGAIEALKNEVSKQESDQMVKGYKERCELTMEKIEASPYLDSFYPQGAFYVFPSYQAEMASLKLANLLLSEAHVATVPGSAFGECGEGYLRLSYSTSKENIVEGLKRIDSVLEKYS